jgi:hypothetical protein
MRSSARARGHLAVLDGSGLPAAVNGRSAGQPVVRVALDRGEWALALLGEDAQRTARRPARDVICGLGECRRHPAGQRYAIARTQPGVLDPWIGPAVLHHSSAGTVLYCPADQITAQAADALAAMAARASEFLRPEAACRVSVTRVGHRYLPTALHPAVATVRPSEITAYVCSRLITAELAAAIGLLCTAYVSHMAPPAPAGAGSAEESAAAPLLTCL